MYIISWDIDSSFVRPSVISFSQTDGGKQRHIITHNVIGAILLSITSNTWRNVSMSSVLSMSPIKLTPYDFSDLQLTQWRFDSKNIGRCPDDLLRDFRKLLALSGHRAMLVCKRRSSTRPYGARPMSLYPQWPYKMPAGQSL